MKDIAGQVLITEDDYAALEWAIVDPDEWINHVVETFGQDESRSIIDGKITDCRDQVLMAFEQPVEEARRSKNWKTRATREQENALPVLVPIKPKAERAREKLAAIDSSKITGEAKKLIAVIAELVADD